jgi:hypothetical protein
MLLINFKEDKQREILAKLGELLIEMAEDGEASDVEETLHHIQHGYLEELGPQDFFGTEGWEHWLGLD